MLLAGDIGGTKTLLGLFEPGSERPEPALVRRFTTVDFDSLDDMVAGFLEQAGHARVEAACFGVAGPVVGDTARLTNVPWRISARDTQERFGLSDVRLLNDLQAMGYAVAVLRDDELAVLQEGDAAPDGNGALIAAGTGLGEAMLHNIDGRFVPASSEGGHADFAPRNGSRDRAAERPHPPPWPRGLRDGPVGPRHRQHPSLRCTRTAARW